MEHTVKYKELTCDDGDKRAIVHKENILNVLKRTVVRHRFYVQNVAQQWIEVDVVEGFRLKALLECRAMCNEERVHL